MGKILYVGNLGSEETVGHLTGLFAAHGAVESARIPKNRDTGNPKGYAFVEMKTGEPAPAATTALNGHDSGGRTLTVREARLRPKPGTTGNPK